MMVSRVDIDQQMSISALLQSINGRFLESVAHQHCSLSQILHAAGEGSQRGQLFNTMVNVQKRGASMAPSSATFGLELLEVYDPSEVSRAPLAG
jgi:non-ribosomal peptide synthetase component F